MTEVLMASSNDNPEKKKVVKKFKLDRSVGYKRLDKQFDFFRTEVSMLQGLKHDNIVKIFSAAHCDGYLGILMEYVPQDLHTILPQLTCALAESYLQQLVDVICFLHQQRVVHGDLKMENVLITDEGKLKLCDFEHAQVIPPSSDHPTRCWYGTKEYNPPEYFRPHLHRNAFKMDTYALGILCSAMLLGTDPNNSIDYLSEVQKCEWIEDIHKRCIRRMLVYSALERATIFEIKSILEGLDEDYPETNSSAFSETVASIGTVVSDFRPPARKRRRRNKKAYHPDCEAPMFKEVVHIDLKTFNLISRELS